MTNEITNVNKIQSNKKRLVWLDIVRCMAIFCVILTHSTETYYTSIMTGQTTCSLSLWLICNFLFTMGRLGVPLFLAVTGALMLNREYKDIPGFYKKSLLPLLVCAEIWTVFNYIFYCKWFTQEFSFKTLIYEMVFLKQPSLSHMWYLPMIIGCYVALPFVSKVLHSDLKLKDCRLLVIAGIAVFFVVPTLNVFIKNGALELDAINIKIDSGFWGGCYGMYMLAGFAVSYKGLLSKIKTSLLPVIIILTFCINSLGQRYLYTHGFFEYKLYWYDNIAILIMGVLLFEFLRRLYINRESIHFGKIINYISRCSFGIYIIHMPIRFVLARMLQAYDFGTAKKMLMLFAADFIISAVILIPFFFVLKRFGKLLFHIK